MLAIDSLLPDHTIIPFDTEQLAFTTGSYVVSPIFFRGGDIGALAVNGTINNLASAGARPLALSLALILEDGVPIDDLRRVIESAHAAAERAGVSIVVGDTRVVAGSGGELFINTSGIGMVPDAIALDAAHVRAGDVILVSGPIGDHGIAVLAQRGGFDVGEVTSDTAPLHELAEAILQAAPDTRALRCAGGGVAATLIDIATRHRLGIDIDGPAVPVRATVRHACEMLELDPLHVANEGKLVAFVPAAAATRALAAMRAHPLGCHAEYIGEVTDAQPGVVEVVTLHGRRVLELRDAEPRIC